MNIKLSEKSQTKRTLPCLKDVEDFELFAFTHLDEVHLFLKLPSFEQPQVLTGEDIPITQGKVYCFNTGRVTDFPEDKEDYYTKVKSIEVETGSESLPRHE